MPLFRPAIVPRHKKRQILFDHGFLAPARAHMRITASVLAGLLVAVGLTVGAIVAPATAAGIVTLTASSTPTILAGENATVSLTATAPAGGTTDYYNLAFRYQLPAGASYVPGSTAGASGPALPDPTIVTITDVVGPPAVTHQVLIWPNIADLVHGSTTGLTFGITPDPSVFLVGSPIPGNAAVYGQTDPRLLAKFTPTTGVVVAGSFAFTDAVTPVSTKVAALKVTKTEPSPEHELMRGAQDQATVYTITTKNTGVAATTGVVLVDYLPAGLEFLGCGSVDNSAAGTEEYPGSGPLGSSTGGPSCATPALVETVNDRAGFLGQVFTKVTWNLGTLTAGSTRTITYSAAIPLKANTMWPAGQVPNAAARLQAANLDNNTGASTRQEAPAAAGQGLTNTAVATGTYTGPVATPADAAATSSDSVTVKAMDLSIVKSVDSSDFVADGIAHFTLLLRSSEYTTDSAMTITDVVPNGLCPIMPASVVVTGPRAGQLPAGCTGGGTVTGATVNSVVANADGSFTVVLTPNPTSLPVNTSRTIGYDALMSSTYAGDSQSGPTVAGDSFLNTVGITGTTTDVTAGLGSTPVTDDSSAGLASSSPTITKKVLPRPAAGGTAVDCAAAVNAPNYTDTQVPTYHLGDKVCFQLTVAFASSTRTRNARITDFTPVGTSFDGFAPASGSTVAVTPATGTESATPAGTLPAAWNLGTPDNGSTDLYVAKGATLTLFVSAIVTSTSPTAVVDITANLMKYRQESTAGAVLALRDQVDYAIAPAPTVSLAKKISAVNGAAPAAPATDVKVKEGDVVTYALDVANTGTAAAGTDVPVSAVQVWDALPAGYTCTTWIVASITPAGSCLNPGDAGYPTTNAVPANSRSVIVWTVPGPLAPGAAATRLSYAVTVPTGVSVSTVFPNTASVVAFTSPNTAGGDTVYFPKGSLNPAHDTDGNALPANSTAQIRLADAAVAKTGVSRIVATGNTANQAVAGELVDYTFSVTVPAHTTVYNGKLSDALPAGLTIPVGTVATVSSVPAGGSFDPTNGALTFPATFDNTTAVDQVFTVTLPGVLVGVGLASGTLTNTATFASNATLGGTAVTPRTAAKAITVVTPLPTLAKIVDKPTAQGNDIVTFTLTAGNTAGRPAAYDSVVVDCLPAGLTLTAFLSPAASPTTTSVPGDGTNGCASGTTRLGWVLPGTGALLAPATTVLTYSARVAPNSAGLVTYTNTASVTGSTLSSNGANNAAVERVVSAAASAVVTVEGATTVKTATPNAVAVGGAVAYTITVTLPKNVNFYNASIIDTLPAGVTANAGSATVTCRTATAVDCIATLPKGPGFTLAPSGQKIGWLLGDVVAATEDRTVTVSVTGTVTTAPANTAGTLLTNTAAPRWNDTAKSDPANAAAGFDRTGPAGSAGVTVLEPVLRIAKTVSNATPEPGQAFTYTVTATNANTATTSDAFAVTIVDTLPAGIDPASVTNISGNGVLSGTTITWTMPTIAKNASVTLTFDARLAASPSLTGSAIVNSVSVTSYASLAAGGRVYTANPPTATAAVTPRFPHIDLAKTATNGATAYVNTPFGWTLTLTNTGAGTAATVTPTDVLPANWVYLAGSGTVSIGSGAAGPLGDPTVTTASGVQTLAWPAFTAVAPGTVISIRYSAQPTAAATVTPGAGAGIRHTNTLSASATDATGATGHAGPAPYAASPVTADAHIDAADVTLAKTAGSALVAGRSTPDAFSITVSNTGPDTAVGAVAGHNFTVTDTPTQPLPTGITATGATGTGWSCTVPNAVTGAFSCERVNANETLAANAAFPAITVAMLAGSGVPNGTAVVNSATVSARTFDPLLGNNTASATNTVTTSADLGITKLASGVFAAGDTATWTIDVTNAGPSTSVGPITVTDTLPGHLSAVSVTGTGWTCTTAATPVSCVSAGGLALSATSRLTVTATIDSDFTGSLTNTVAVTGTTPDPNPANNSSAPTTPVGSATTLSIAKTLQDAQLVPGTDATYRFVVANTGRADARNVRIADALPNGLTFVRLAAGTPGAWTCTETSTTPSTIGCVLTGTLKPGAGATQTVDVVVAVPSGLTGSVVNTATAGADNAPDASDNTNTGLIGKADLGITKTHPAGAVTAGTDLTYSLSVTNYGPSDAPAGTVVTDHIPAGLVAQGADGGADWTCAAPVGQDVTCTSTSILPVGATAGVVSVTVGIPANAGPAGFTNVADVTGVLDEPTPNAHPNTASDPTDVTTHADVTIVKTIVPSARTVTAGGSIGYALTVTNAGPSTADALTVADTLPAGFTATAISGAGWTCVLASLSCTRAQLGVTNSVISVTASVAAAVPDGTRAVNTATVGWTDSRSSAHTDTDTVPVTVVAIADLELNQSTATATPLAGADVVFDFALRNVGTSDAIGPITITDTLPAGLRFRSNTVGWTCVASAVAASAPQVVTCTLGDGSTGLAAGGTATALSITVSTDPTLGAVTLDNPAIAATPTTESTLVNNPSPVRVLFARSADLSLVKTHFGSGAIGAPTPFTLTVSNAGPSSAVGVRVVDTLPVGLTWVDSAGSDPAWSCSAAASTPVGSTDVSCALATPVAAGADAPTLVVNALVDARSFPTVTNAAAVTAVTPDPDPANNSATDPLVVAPLVSLAVTKHHTGQAIIGSNLDYLVAVTNTGATADPGGFTVVDVLPAGLSYVSGHGDAVTCAAGSDAALVTCTFAGALAVGATRTVTITVSVLATAFPTVVNTVTAHSLYADPAAPAAPAAQASDSATVLKALAHTGIDLPVELLALLALLALLLGAALVLTSRRRRAQRAE
ncbi:MULTISPECIES: S-layer family protein [unclassified Cryobacterium]|uniref:beta strand repeat-containing protein n=2 Tax=Bacteria TaxID=2 RepID=UPI00141A93FF|nr:MULTISPECIES: isopeptide-forming domain-containing fimbrial protein [unclassified Cryobacterium]